MAVGARRVLVAAALAVALAAAAGCDGPPTYIQVASPPDAGTPTLVPLFTTGDRSACEFSAPLAVTSAGAAALVIATADGVVSALDPQTGGERWRVALPAPAGLLANLVAPPAVVGQRLVVAWQDVEADWTRVDHRVAVVDLDTGALDPDFAPVTLAGSQPTADGASTIAFEPDHAFSRSAVVHVDVPDRQLGLAYVSFGNVRDLQPWHGWMFELDLDAWQSGGAAAAVTASLVTTAAESDCGATDSDGAKEMICGGGIWAALGPAVVADPTSPDGFALLVTTGNGLLDPTRGSYANAVLRLGRGLAFDPGCDATLCDGFDPTAPTDACAASCPRLFIPRLPPGQLEPRGSDDGCVGLTLFQCWATFDWDLGAGAPLATTLPGGPNLILQPGKDGAVYLIDADHLGTLYDRAPIMPGCGEGGGTCAATWAGTITTRPALATVDGAPVVLVPTFIEDDVHPAGLQALDLGVGPNGPQLSPRWQAPAAGTPAAVSGFRGPPSGVTVVEIGGQPYAAVTDTSTAPATLYWVRVRDGAIIQTVALAGDGQRFAPPLATNGILYVPSCQRTGTPSFEEGPSLLQAFAIATP